MPKSNRTVEVIEREYYAKVAELGDREFKMTVEFPVQIENLKRELRNLVKESAEAREKETKAQAHAALQAKTKSKNTDSPVIYEPQQEASV